MLVISCVCIGVSCLSYSNFAPLVARSAMQLGSKVDARQCVAKPLFTFTSEHRPREHRLSSPSRDQINSSSGSRQPRQHPERPCFRDSLAQVFRRVSWISAHPIVGQAFPCLVLLLRAPAQVAISLTELLPFVSVSAPLHLFLPPSTAFNGVEGGDPSHESSPVYSQTVVVMRPRGGGGEMGLRGGERDP